MTNEVANWPTTELKWEREHIDVLKEGSIDTKLQSENLTNIITKSNKFPIKFPIESIRCKTLVNAVEKETLQRNIDSAYPLIHEYALNLCARFLLYKRKNGSKIEQKFYKNLSVLELINRLLRKRPAMFVDKCDVWLLMDGSLGSGKWETIGTNKEKKPLVLKNYMSYDEIKLSVFLSVSSYSYFINNGTRNNNGVPTENRAVIEPEGIVIGLIGARFRRINVMEFQEIIITKTQNIPENGYGDVKKLPSVFADLYEEPCFTYKDFETKIASDKNKRFTKLTKDMYFDNVVYSKRLSLSFDTLLLEANHRSVIAKKFAYIHVVGIGLGVWKVSSHQENVFIETFLQRINTLSDKLSNVSDIDFSYIGDGITVKDYFDGNIIKILGHPKDGIKIHVSTRDPYTKIEEGKLLVVSYAWDGNSLPGNEYWLGKLDGTSDSSTASSTQVSELHNPHINSMVNAKNLMIVTINGLITIQEYIKKFGKQEIGSDGDDTLNTSNCFC